MASELGTSALSPRWSSPLAADREGWSRWLVALLAGAVLAATLLLALRVEILRLRYALDASLAAERRLEKQVARVATRYWALRDPMRLQEHALREGFVRPACRVELPPTAGRGRIACAP